MTLNSFIDLKKKYKTGAFRWQVIELYRLGLVGEAHILAELKISRTSLHRWNRAYQRYRLRRYYPDPKRIWPMKTDVEEIARLKFQLAQTEKLLQAEKLKHEAAQTMITIAEKGFNISIRKKSGRVGGPTQTVDELSRHHPLVSMQTLCGLFGKSRQAWYEAQKKDENDDCHAMMLLSEVRRLRLDLPSIGVDVLHHQLTEFRRQHGIKVGRDRLANLLRDSGLLIKRRSRYAKTTWSGHRFYKYPNLTIGKTVLALNRLCVLVD